MKLGEIKIGQRTVGSEHPPFIIAEMSGNHNQSLDRALAIVEAAALLLLLSAASLTAKTRPNILFIAVDDLNDWTNCLGGCPSPIRTPNLDRLAASGVLFTAAYCAAPACGPSRAAVMTGLRPSTTGVYFNKIHSHLKINYIYEYMGRDYARLGAMTGNTRFGKPQWTEAPFDKNTALPVGQQLLPGARARRDMHMFVIQAVTEF